MPPTPPWSVYRLYGRDDCLCQSNGYFSLNLRQGALHEIDRLLELRPGDRVGWVGCGDGRELLSLAGYHPGVRFEGYEINEAALRVASRVLTTLGLQNVSLFYRDFITVANDVQYTHVYSTALAGPMLYDRLRLACTQRLCMLDKMWTVKKGREHNVATVRIAGSGEQRALWCANVVVPVARGLVV